MKSPRGFKNRNPRLGKGFRWGLRALSFFLLLSSQSSYANFSNKGSNSNFLNTLINQIYKEQALLQDTAPEYAQSVSVLIHGDPMVFSPHRVGREVRRIEKQFGHPVIVYKAYNAQEFIEALKKISRSSLVIENLVVRGIHGAHFDGVPYFEVVDTYNDDFEAVGFDDLKKHGVNISFSPSAFIYFDSCTMIDNSSEDRIYIGFSELKKIGFESGWVYLNNTNGSSAVENIFTVPFYEQGNDWKHKLRQAVLQAGWPVTIPIFYYFDRFTSNEGYIFGRSPRRESIFRSRADQVKNGISPKKLFLVSERFF